MSSRGSVLVSPHKWGSIDTTRLLSGGNLLVPGCLLCGYWLGFVSRFILAARFEIRDRTQRGPMMLVYSLAALGHASLLLSWLNFVPGLLLGWTSVLAGLGWVMGHSCVYRISLLSDSEYFLPAK